MHFGSVLQMGDSLFVVGELDVGLAQTESGDRVVGVDFQHFFEHADAFFGFLLDTLPFLLGQFFGFPFAGGLVHADDGGQRLFLFRLFDHSFGYVEHGQVGVGHETVRVEFGEMAHIVDGFVHAMVTMEDDTQHFVGILKFGLEQDGFLE